MDGAVSVSSMWKLWTVGRREFAVLSLAKSVFAGERLSRQK